MSETSETMASLSEIRNLDFDGELAKHQNRTALFDEVLQIRDKLNSSEAEIGRKKAGISEKQDHIQCLTVKTRTLEQEAAALKMKHELDLAEWRELAITGKQVFFSEGMAGEDLASATFCAKLNATLVGEQSELSRLADTIGEVRSTRRGLETSIKEDQEIIKSLGLTNLEGELRIAETNWGNSIEDTGRIAHLEQVVAVLKQTKRSLSKTNKVLEKEIGILKNKEQLMGLDEIGYGLALKHASRLMTEYEDEQHEETSKKRASYEKQYGFSPDFVWAVFRKRRNYIKILNWHSALKHFCTLSGEDFYTTEFGLEFELLRRKVNQRFSWNDCSNWRAKDFICPDISLFILSYPRKVFANLERAYNIALEQYQIHMKALDWDMEIPQEVVEPDTIMTKQLHISSQASRSPLSSVEPARVIGRAPPQKRRRTQTSSLQLTNAVKSESKKESLIVKIPYKERTANRIENILASKPKPKNLEE